MLRLPASAKTERAARKPFVRTVRAERTGLNFGGGEFPQLAVLLRDSLERRPNRAGYRDAGAVSAGRDLPFTAGE